MLLLSAVRRNSQRDDHLFREFWKILPILNVRFNQVDFVLDARGCLWMLGVINMPWFPPEIPLVWMKLPQVRCLCQSARLLV